MLESFIEGFLLGIGASVPLGPINILIMSYALRQYSLGVAIGAGAMSADMSYLLLIIFGLFYLVQSPTLQLITAVIGSLFLLYLAWQIFQSQAENIDIKNSKDSSILRNYLKGYTLTLLNPYTILFWLSVSSYIATKNLNPFTTILGLLSAISLWITLMPWLIHKTKHLFSQKIIKLFSIVSAGILIFFALGMLWHILKDI